MAGTDDFDINDFDQDEKELYNLFISQEERRQNKEFEQRQKAWQTRRTKAEIQKKEIEELKKQIQVEQTQSEHPKTQKIPNILPISQTNKKNIYQQPITQNIQQKNKVDNFNYLKKGVLRI